MLYQVVIVVEEAGKILRIGTQNGLVGFDMTITMQTYGLFLMTRTEIDS